jgi:hypothetical protein
VNSPTRTRHVALVGPLVGERRTAETAGYPLDPAKMLPVADVVLIVADAGAGAMLFRYTAHGEFGGDTWHATADDAREQATYEYGDALGEWMEVDADVTDAHVFAVKYAHDRLNSRGDW